MAKVIILAKLGKMASALDTRETDEERRRRLLSSRTFAVVLYAA